MVYKKDRRFSPTPHLVERSNNGHGGGAVERAAHLWEGRSLASRNISSAGLRVLGTNASPRQRLLEGPSVEIATWVGKILHAFSPMGTLEYRCTDNLSALPHLTARSIRTYR